MISPNHLWIPQSGRLNNYRASMGSRSLQVFSDILTPLPAMGIDFDVVRGRGPIVLGDLARTLKATHRGNGGIHMGGTVGVKWCVCCMFCYLTYFFPKRRTTSQPWFCFTNGKPLGLLSCWASTIWWEYYAKTNVFPGAFNITWTHPPSKQIRNKSLPGFAQIPTNLYIYLRDFPWFLMVNEGRDTKFKHFGWFSW